MVVKSYLRYERAATLGQVFSHTSAAAWHWDGRRVFSPAQENVLTWDSRTFEQAGRTFADDEGSSCLVVVVDPSGGSVQSGVGNMLVRNVATGHENGTVNLWHWQDLVEQNQGANKHRGTQSASLQAQEQSRNSRAELVASLQGHRSAVISLCFISDHATAFPHRLPYVQTSNGVHSAKSAAARLLASGSRDADIVIWDVVAECGLFRLSGHKGPITALTLIPASMSATSTSPTTQENGDSENGVADDAEALPRLVSASTDTFLKVWDLQTQYCVDTLVGHRSEVWSLATNPAGSRVISGSGDDELQLWEVQESSSGPAAEPAATLNGAASDDRMDEDDGGVDGRKDKGDKKSKNYVLSRGTTLHSAGPIRRESVARVQGVDIHTSGRLVVTAPAEKSIEVYRVRTAEEVKKRAKKRAKRSKKLQEQLAEAGGASGEDVMAAMAVDTADSAVDRSKAEDELGLVQMIKTVAKVKWVAFSPHADAHAMVERLQHKVLSEDGEDGDAGATKASSGPILLGVIAAGLMNNSIEVYGVAITNRKATVEHFGTIGATNGHRTDIRSLALSSDNALLASGSHGEVKLWNPRSGAMVRSMASGYALCVAFVPGDRHVLVGTREGKIVLCDVSSATAVEETLAHDGPIWGMRVLPNKRGFVTCSGDKTIKFWDFELVRVTVRPDGTEVGPDDEDEEDEDSDGCSSDNDGESEEESSTEGEGDEDEESDDDDDDLDLEGIHPARREQMLKERALQRAKEGKQPSGKLLAKASKQKPAVISNTTTTRLSFSLARTATMTDDVLSIMVTRSGDHVAVSLLDSTIKVLFADSLNLHLSMYGHKLPVTALDVSSDGTLLASGSADKNLKFWGMDFGDCHRSLFAHSDGITAVAFQPGTHYLFTASKDRTIKYWDGDTHQLILKFSNEHKGEVWGLVMSSSGDFFASASQDRSLRLFRRTEEQVFLEEEREREQEREMEEQMMADEATERERARTFGTGTSGRHAAAADALGDPSLLLKGDGDGNADDGEAEDGAALQAATRRTMGAIKGAESLLEAIELLDEELTALRNYEEEVEEVRLQHEKLGGEMQKVPKPERNLMLEAMDMTAREYFLRALRKLKSAEVEEALMLVPFHHVLSLFTHMQEILAKRQDVELATRCVLFLVQLHHRRLSTTPAAADVLYGLRREVTDSLAEQRARIGFNLAGLGIIRAQMDAQNFAPGAFVLPTTEPEKVSASAIDPVARAKQQKKRRDAGLHSNRKSAASATGGRRAIVRGKRA
eukprot:Clim_evm11s161 gene=Clim_evmTU11s161